MKVAVTGKGGAGKTTLVAILVKLLSEKGKKVFAIDADPDTNLGLILGFPEPDRITPLISLKELIAERTGTEVGKSTPYFRLNPKVDDIPDKYFVQKEGIKLAVMGTVRGGGLGCTCPENAFLKALLRHLMTEREEVVILDMEAGIEHLGRGTVEAVDSLIIVVEPNQLSVETAKRIKNLAREIGLSRIQVVGNKVREESDWKFITDNLSGFEFLGFLSFQEGMREADLQKKSLFECCPQIMKEGEKVLSGLIYS